MRVIAAFWLLVAACSSADGVAPLGASVPPPEISTVATAQETQLPRLTAAQARATATLVAFFDAYNAGQLDAAADLLVEDVVVNDCDYSSGHVIAARGKHEAGAWLRKRISDRDQLVIADFYFGVPNQLGAFAVAVSYERRTSDALRSVGLPNGIKPRFATKVVVTRDGDRLMAFNQSCER